AWTLTQKMSSNPDDDGNQPSDDEIIRKSEDDNEQKSAEDEENKEEDADNNEDEADSSDEDEEEEDTEGEFSVEEEGTGSSPLSTMSFTYSGDTLEVKFEVEDAAYISLQNEDETYLQEGTIEPGEDQDPIDVS